jgi:hypothetical protein
MSQKVVIVPCSGIGKTYGTVSREAAYEVIEELRPETSQSVALSRLVLGEENARAAVAANPAITIDGCKLAMRYQNGPGERRQSCPRFCRFRRLSPLPKVQAPGYC